MPTEISATTAAVQVLSLARYSERSNGHSILRMPLAIAWVPFEGIISHQETASESTKPCGSSSVDFDEEIRLLKTEVKEALD